MFKLNYIEVGPFRSFVEPQRIDFPENGLFLIQGKNLDTGGSSGSGKSNLLLAIEYAFGSCPFSSTVLGSWFSDEPPTVKLGVKLDNKLLELNRAKSLSITENCKSIDGSAKQKDEYLLKEIGLSPEVRQSLTYRGQKKPGIFLNKNNSEKTEFLMPLLDLERFEKANDETDQQIKALTENLNNLKSSLQTLEETKSGIKIEDAQNLINKIHDYKIILEQEEEGLKQAKENQEFMRQKAESDAIAARDHYLKTNRYTEEKEKLSVLLSNPPVFQLDETELNKLQNILTECQQRLDKLKAKDSQCLKEYNDNKKQIQLSIDIASKKAGALAGFEKEYARLQNQIDIIKQNKCPTCSREWIENQDKLNTLFEEISKVEFNRECAKAAQSDLIKLKEGLNNIAPFEPNPTIAKLESIKNEQLIKIAEEKQKIESAKKLHNSKWSKEVAELKASIAQIEMEANHRLTNIRAKFANETNRIYLEEIKVIENRRSSIANELNTLQRDLVKYETTKKQIDQLEEQINKKIQLKKIAELDLHAESDLSKLIGREGFLGNIFDEVLDEISAETNNTLAKIANTAHISIEFKSERLTEKGNVKKTIIPIVNVGGNTGPLNSALSGGQITTVELAVDLAVGAVISRRTGVTPGYLILDESFAVGLDDVSKEACFELLKIYSCDRLILVIDHDTQFKSMFSKSIIIEFKDGKSTIVEDSV